MDFPTMEYDDESDSGISQRTMDEDQKQWTEDCSVVLPKKFTMERLLECGITFPTTKSKKPTIKRWNKLTESIPHIPGENYGIRTGKVSKCDLNVIVIDCDVIKKMELKKNAYVDGVEAWKELTKKYGDPKAPSVSTPSGGKHLYFQYVEGVQSSVQKLHGELLGVENRGRTIKIDVLSDGKCVMGWNSPGYTLNGLPSQIIPPFPGWLMNLVSLPRADYPSSQQFSNKRREIESGNIDLMVTRDCKRQKQSMVTPLLKRRLRSIVLDLEQRHSDVYTLWCNVLWSLRTCQAQYGYETLDIADEFSKRSVQKYRGTEDVSKMFHRSKGGFDADYIIRVSRIYTEKLEEFSKYLTTKVPKTHQPVVVHEIDTNVRHKWKIVVNSADDKERTLWYLRTDIFALQDSEDHMLAFLENAARSKRSDLIVFGNGFINGYDATFMRDRFIFISLDEKDTVIIVDPLKKTKTLLYGKTSRSSQIRHSEIIGRTVRACTLQAIKDHTGRYYGDEHDNDNVVEDSEKDMSVRKDVELVWTLIESDPSVQQRYVYCENDVYYCDRNTGKWIRGGKKALEKLFVQELFQCGQLTKAETEYIKSRNGYLQVMEVFLSYVVDNSFKERLNTNRNLFPLQNCTVDVSSGKPVFRDITRDDYVCLTADWVYDNESAKEHRPAVEKYLAEVFPVDSERQWILQFIARLLSGKRSEKKFVCFTDKRKGNNGKSTFVGFLELVFGKMLVKNSKLVVSTTKAPDMNQHDAGLASLRGRRILIAEELKKNQALNIHIMKALTGGSTSSVEGRELYAQSTFQTTNQCALILIYNEGDCPTFDAADPQFKNRMVICPFRSLFVEQSRYEAWKNESYVFQEDEQYADNFQSWRSAFLQILVENYSTKLPEVGESQNEWKDEVCRDNDVYTTWMDDNLQIEKDKYVSATDILRAVYGLAMVDTLSKNMEIKIIKGLMKDWALKNGGICKYYGDNVRKRIPKTKTWYPRSALINVSIVETPQ